MYPVYLGVTPAHKIDEFESSVHSEEHTVRVHYTARFIYPLRVLELRSRRGMLSPRGQSDTHVIKSLAGIKTSYIILLTRTGINPDVDINAPGVIFITHMGELTSDTGRTSVQSRDILAVNPDV
jgi:hypothetical protein